MNNNGGSGKTITETISSHAHLPEFLKFPLLRRTLHLPSQFSSDLEVRPVCNLEELKEGLRLVHDVFVEDGLLSEKPSGMKITKYHLLPSTTLVAAFLRGKIVAAVTLVRCGAFSTPSVPYLEQNSTFFEHERFLEPIDMAISKEMRSSNNHELFFALIRYIYQFAQVELDCTAILISSQPRLIEFLKGVCLLEEIAKQSNLGNRIESKYPVFGFIDLPDSAKKLYLTYRNTDKKRNLYKFSRSEFSCFQKTSGVFGSVDNFVLGPKNVSLLLEKASFLATTLTLEEKLRLLSVHGWPVGWESLICLPNIAGVEVFNVRRERRFETKLEGVLAESEDERYWKGIAVKVLDLSRKGCRLTLSRTDLILKQPFLRISIDDKVHTFLKLELQRKYADGNAGYRILSFEKPFEDYMEKLENENQVLKVESLTPWTAHKSAS